jgi:hypothetical protein
MVSGDHIYRNLQTGADMGYYLIAHSDRLGRSDAFIKNIPGYDYPVDILIRRDPAYLIDRVFLVFGIRHTSPKNHSQMPVRCMQQPHILILLSLLKVSINYRFVYKIPAVRENSPMNRVRKKV